MSELGEILDKEQLLEASKLFAPEFVEYRGGVFRRDAFKSEKVDDFFVGNDLAAVEAVVNHVHIFDVVTDEGVQDEDPALWSAALRLADAWRALLAARFPQREFEVTCQIGYGPEVTFSQVPRA